MVKDTSGAAGGPSGDRPEPGAAAERVDVEQILKGIREEIRHRHPESADLPRWDGGGARGGPPVAFDPLPVPVIFSPHLRYLNERWQLEPLFPISSHRRGVGTVVVLSKRALRKVVMGLFLPIFEHITGFFSNVTNFLNALAKNLDQVQNQLLANDELLRDRVGGLERETGERLDRSERGLVERMDLLHGILERELLALGQRVVELEDALRGADLEGAGRGPAVGRQGDA